MRIELPGDPPAWFLLVWLALGATSLATRILLDRRSAVRTPPRPEETAGWQPTPFSLTVYERNIFGVRQVGDTVVFGPSGRQVAGAALLPLVAVIAAGSVAATDPAQWVLLLTSVGTGAAIVFGLAGLRVRVWLSLADMAFRSRFGRLRRFAWTEVDGVRAELRSANVQLRGSSSFAAVGVVRAIGERAMDLPGFRCIAWVDEEGRDELT
ncbi:MAG: hypothetical protein WCC60_01980, partial [Ilumatobacteraceae bacterium]